MLPIYICEDDDRIRSIQKKYLENQILMQGYDMEIVICSRHPEDIIEALEISKKKGIYFLDV